MKKERGIPPRSRSNIGLLQSASGAYRRSTIFFEIVSLPLLRR